MIDVDASIYYAVLMLSSAVVAYATWVYVRKHFKSSGRGPVQRVQRQPQQRRRAGGGGGAQRRAAAQNRMEQRMARGGAAAGPAVAVPRRAEAEAEASNSSSDDEKKEGGPQKKVGTKKARKLAEKEERKKQREAEAVEREERKRAEAEKLQEKRNEEAEEERLEKEKELEEQRLREEEERKEEEEYQRLKAFFEVAEEGTEACEDEDAMRAQLANFAADVRAQKVVFIDQLAESYQMKTMDCIERINELCESGELSGVLDDRGKFIFISSEEYEAVARFVRQRGRVSLRELASNSGRLIHLGTASA